MNYFLNWQEHAGSQSEKFYKTTLWQGEHVMIGLNCLEPGQTQKVHAHQGADKFYFVLEGSGSFTVGDDEREAAAGSAAAAPAKTYKDGEFPLYELVFADRRALRNPAWGH